MSTIIENALKKATEGKSPEFWPSDFLHILAKLLFDAGKENGSKDVLKASNELATIAAGVANRMSKEEFPLKKRFQSIMQEADEFDIFGHERATQAIRQAYRELVKRAYRSSGIAPRMDSKYRKDAPAFLNKLKSKIAKKDSEAQKQRKKYHFRRHSDLAPILIALLVGFSTWFFSSLIGTAAAIHVFKKGVREGKLTEQMIVRDFSTRFINKYETKLDAIQDPIQRKDVENLIMQLKRAKSYNDLIAIMPSCKALRVSKHLYDKAIRERNEAL